MNQRSQGLMMFKALTGFLQYKGAEGIASRTVEGYRRDLKVWIESQGDQDILEIESQQILAFLNYMRNDYVPHRITGGSSRKLTPKTIYNIYISLASFFTWASREFNIFNPMNLFSAPCKTGFVQKRHFWLVGGDFCRNFIGFHLAFGKLNRK